MTETWSKATHWKLDYNSKGNVQGFNPSRESLTTCIRIGKVMGLGLGDLSRSEKVMRWTSNKDWLIEGSGLQLPGRQVHRLKANEQGNTMERSATKRDGFEVERT
jgi:hypothetical protein